MYNKILVPMDGSELAECVLPHVESIAGGCGVKNVIFVRVVEPFYRPSGDYGAALSDEDVKRIEIETKAAAENYLNDLTKKVKYNGVSVQAKVLNGKAADIIVDYAAKNGVDLITMSTHGRSGVSRWVWGSVADRVLRSSCVPVMMVRAPGCVPGV